MIGYLHKLSYFPNDSVNLFINSINTNITIALYSFEYNNIH